MAYKSDMKKINLALSQDDYTKFIGVKSFLGLKTDADVIRACISECYLNLCMDLSKVESIKSAIDDIEELKNDLNKILFQYRKEM